MSEFTWSDEALRELAAIFPDEPIAAAIPRLLDARAAAESERDALADRLRSSVSLRCGGGLCGACVACRESSLREALRAEADRLARVEATLKAKNEHQTANEDEFADCLAIAERAAREEREARIRAEASDAESIAMYRRARDRASRYRLRLARVCMWGWSKRAAWRNPGVWSGRALSGGKGEQQ